MSRILEVSEKLTLISEQEWKVIIKRAKDHVKIRLCGKTSRGVHCEANLSMPAEDYYTTKAIEKIYSGVWDWKFETFTLSEQIIRIIDSMISENVRQWKTNEDKRLVFTEFDPNIEIPDYCENDNNNFSNDSLDKLETIIGDDEDAYMLLQGILEKKTYDEICELIGCHKKKLYKIIERLRRYIKTRDKPL